MMNDQSQPCVAVVAIHGVGDQIPNRTAEKVASLLLTLDREGGGTQYQPFDETKVRIGTRPMEAGKVRPTDDCAQEFTYERLSNFRGEDTIGTYETVRLEGARLGGDPPRPRQRIHVYDMYWADLSRLGTGLLRAFGALFQLIFHVGDLGRQTAQLAENSERASKAWKAVRKVQVAAVWILTCPLVILNLYEVAVILVFLPAKLQGLPQQVVAWAVLTVLVAVLVGRALFWRVPSGRGGYIWGFAPLVVLGVVWWFELVPFVGYYRLLAIEWGILAGWLLYRLLYPYTQFRDDAGAFPRATGLFALVMAGVAAGVFSSQIWSGPGTEEMLYRAALRTLEPLYAFVLWSWIALLLLIGVQFVLLCWILWRGPGPARRAAATVLISLAHPTALFRVLTLALWGVLWFGAKKVMPSQVAYSPSDPFRNLVLPRPENGSGYNSVDDLIKGLLGISQTPLFTLAVLGMALALVLCVWGLFPVVWAEVFPPRDDKDAESLGRWLSYGYSLSRVAAACMFFTVAMMVLGYAAYVLDKCWDQPALKNWADGLFPHTDLLGIVSGLLFAVFAGLLTFRGPLEKLSLGFHAAVGVALDVDNSLREFPRDATPRARIFARYASLLRYLCNWTSSENPAGYDAIVIVAHSQGSVITADLLRYLQFHRDKALAKLGHDIPVYLLTVGNPLRQLYGWRFPHLYAWAYHDVDTSWTEDNPQPIPADQVPDPKLLGLKRWVNGYRSGDYVGRYLWRSAGCAYLWTPGPRLESRSDDNTRREFCLGAGAHTHYFDETAPALGKHLDILLAEAMGAVDRPSTLPSATRPVRPELVALLKSLQPGQRIRLTQSVRVGSSAHWTTTVEGVFRSVKFLTTGLATDRVPEDDIVVVSVHFTKEDGELSSITLDEHSQIDDLRS